MSAFVVTDNNREYRVHREGCADIKRKHERVFGEGATVNEALEDAFVDFINEGSMSVEDAHQQAHILPCTTEVI